MVHQGSGLDDPGIGALSPWIAAFLSAIDRAFLLGFADEDDAFSVAEVFALLFGKVVFALSFLKGDKRSSVVLGEALDGADELACDRLHHVSGGDFMSAVDSYELQCTFDGLELGHIYIEALRYIRSMLSTSNTTCLLNTSATVCGTLIATPVAGCLHGQAIRLTAVPYNGVVYHSQFDARNRSCPSTLHLTTCLSV